MTSNTGYGCMLHHEGEVLKWIPYGQIGPTALVQLGPTALVQYRAYRPGARVIPSTQCLQNYTRYNEQAKHILYMLSVMASITRPSVILPLQE